MIACWPAVFKPFLLFKVVLDALKVTWPLPLCIIIQLKPVGKLVGTVIVIALPLEQLIIVPLSVAARVFDVPDSALISAPKPVNGLSLKSVFPVPSGAIVILPLHPMVLVKQILMIAR